MQFLKVLKIELCKQTLEKKGKKLTLKQVEQIRAFLYQMAFIEFDHYKSKAEDEKRYSVRKSFD